jgi:hypothetical protein
MESRALGLSWVAVWTVVFTVVIPTRPRKALLAGLASVGSVPVVIGFMVATQRTTFSPDPVQFFFWIVFPYLLSTTMAYVGAHVVYSLGKAVSEARELGSYRLVERLGQGGMGEVWRAQHRLLARPAAIKLIRNSGAGDVGASEETVRRFEQEAQVTAGLSSPHTVQLFDFAHTPPTPPSERSELPIPPALDRLVMACLAKSPGERPQSAKELSRRLGEVDGLNQWTEERAKQWWEVHRPDA